MFRRKPNGVDFMVGTFECLPFNLTDHLGFSNLLDLLDFETSQTSWSSLTSCTSQTPSLIPPAGRNLVFIRQLTFFPTIIQNLRFAVQTRVLVFNATYKWCGRQLKPGPGLTSFTQVSPRLFIPHLNYGSIYFKWTDF